MAHAVSGGTNARGQLIETTIAHLAVHGPTGVQTQDVCRELGFSKALVNYHFGGRDGLVLEAMATAYERYVDELNRAAAAAGSDPMDRLIAWIDCQVEWTGAHPGLAAALDFPTVAIADPRPDDPALLRMEEAGARNFGNLQRLVRAARASLLGVDHPDQLDDTDVGLAAAVVGWVALGLAIWSGGNHLPTRSERLRRFLPLAHERMRASLEVMLSQP